MERKNLKMKFNQEKQQLYFKIIGLLTFVISGCCGEHTANQLKLAPENHSTTMGNNSCSINIAYYEEIKDLPNHPEKLLIEVRTREEILETGIIPTSINIPLLMVQQELSQNVNAEEFLSKYGRNKPATNAAIIFTCRSGVRAKAAAEIAVSLGYTNVKYYKGSWIDWAEHEGLPK